MLKGSVILAVAWLLVPISGAAQQHGKAAQFEEWHRDVHRAAELYVAGDTAGGLALLDKRQAPPDEHRELGKAIFFDLELPVVDAANRQPLPRPEPRLHPVWTMRLVRALAALHMEGVLDAYNRQTEEGLGDHLAIAEYLFANIARIENRPDAAPAWELAIGLTAITEVRTIWAQSFLDAACAQYPDDTALLLACGSVHEAVAMLPAGVLARWPAPPGSRSELLARDTAPVIRSDSGLDAARPTPMTANARVAMATHLTQLDAAVKALERVLQMDPANVEARIRLAHALGMKGKEKEAAALLVKILAGTPKTETRARYLAGLFLGAIRIRAKDFDGAAAQFQAASDCVPTAQTAQIALAFVMHARGEGARSADVLDHAVQASDEWADPWWGYRYAQYWIIKPLLATLRKDVTR